MKPINRPLAIDIIAAAISIGLLLQIMIWRIQVTGVDGITEFMGLADIGILVIAVMEFHHELCHA